MGQQCLLDSQSQLCSLLCDLDKSFSLPGLIPHPSRKWWFLRRTKTKVCLSPAGTSWLFWEAGLHKLCCMSKNSASQPPVKQSRDLLHSFPDRRLKTQRFKWPVTLQSSYLRVHHPGVRLELSAMVFLLCQAAPVQAQYHWFKCRPAAGLRLSLMVLPVRTHSQLCLVYSFGLGPQWLRAPGETCSRKPPRGCPGAADSPVYKLILPRQWEGRELGQQEDTEEPHAKITSIQIPRSTKTPGVTQPYQAPCGCSQGELPVEPGGLSHSHGRLGDATHEPF